MAPTLNITKAPWFSDRHWSSHVLILLVLGYPTFFIEGGWFGLGLAFVVVLIFVVYLHIRRLIEGTEV